MQDGNDSDQEAEISSAKSAPETSYSLDTATSKQSISQSPKAPAAPVASTSGRSDNSKHDHIEVDHSYHSELDHSEHNHLGH